MSEMISMWWHLKRHKGHVIIAIPGMTVPLFDMYAKGILYRCTCERTWAR